MTSQLKSVLICGVALTLLACGQSDTTTSTTFDPSIPGAKITNATLRNAATTPDEWLTYGGTYEEQRFSTLNKITKDNISELDVAWSFELSTSRGVESTPIVVDGVMYVTSAWSIVHALDAKTGEELWSYDPEVAGEDAVKGCCDVVNRGVAVYDGKVYLGVFDGRLEALNAKTGAVIWSKVTVDQSKPYSITMAPRVVNGNVIIGNSGGELGVRGYVSAYDAKTGDLNWRFYTVPNPNKKPDGAASDAVFAKLANDTWGDTGGWVTDGGGGTAWDSVVFDQDSNTLIVGVGNGSPWNAKVRDPDSDGDNLFLSSILGLDATTGEYKWHFQTTPRDQWDFTATQTLILADLPLGEGGATRKVVMQAPKNGFFYVLDAATGEYISGDAFVPMTWATGLDETGRPIENPDARKTDGEGFLALPGPLGAHNWHPMAYSPQTGLAYIPAQSLPQLIQDQLEETKDEDSYWNTGYNFAAGVPVEFPAGTVDYIRSLNTGSLLAWDPVARKPRWAVEHDGPWNGGILTTASGLVFQGRVKGDVVAYDAATGDKLWSKNVKSGALSGLSTYTIDGEQYVAMTTGWGTAFALSAGHAMEQTVGPDVGRVVTFKLGGTGTVPDAMLAMSDRTPKTESFGDSAIVESGMKHYSQNCMVCHGPLAVSSGVLPDLRWSYASGDRNEWLDIVYAGSLSENGMVSFKEQLDEDEMESIRAYVIHQGHQAVANGEAALPTTPVEGESLD